MPFRIDKVRDGYRIYNLDKKKYTKPTFKTKKSALNMKKVWINFDKNFK
tara:strand:- start:1995 stop:2141 length:147 start_codon:yes stop_codon:yes gene_type:complete